MGFLTLAAAGAVLPLVAAQVTIIESSSTGEQWANKGQIPWTSPSSNAKSYVVVDRSTALQEIMGFGGALTDTSAINFLMMNDTTKQNFLTAYWDAEQGLGYTGELAVGVYESAH